MRSLRPIACFLALAILLAAGLACKPDLFQAGAATSDITPPQGAPLGGYMGYESFRYGPDPDRPTYDPNGYSKLFKASRGVHDPLRASALVLDDGRTRLALVQADIAVVTEDLQQAVARRLTDAGIAPDHLILFATHNHSGQGAYVRELLGWLGMDVFDSRIFDSLADGIADAVVRAAGALEPAAVGMGAGELSGITVNRRGDTGSLDPSLAVLRVDRMDGAPLAALIHYAIHGNLLGPENLLVSADIPGAAERIFSETIGGGVTTLFAQAPEGDVDPIGQGSTDFDRVEELGGTIARAAASVYAATATDPEVDLAFAASEIELPPAHVLPGLFSPEVPLSVQIPLGGLAPRTAPIRAFRIGSSVLTTFPGEPIVAVGSRLRSEAAALGFEDLRVLALANGHIMYVTSEDEYWQGGYESFLTLYGPETADVLVEASLALLAKLPAPGDGSSSSGSPR